MVGKHRAGDEHQSGADQKSVKDTTGRETSRDSDSGFSAGSRSRGEHSMGGPLGDKDHR